MPVEIVVFVVFKGDWTLKGIFFAAGNVFGEGKNKMLFLKAIVFKDAIELEYIGLLPVVVKSNGRCH